MLAPGGAKSALEPCIYTTTYANQSVQIIYHKEYAQRIYLEDGTELDVSDTGLLNYTFPNAGEHQVWIEFKEDATTFYYCFYNCSGLTSIPENLFAANTAVTDFASCFRNCSGLTSIPENLFAANTAVTTFANCFQYCSGLTSIPGNLFAANTAVTTFTSCFFSCTNIATSCPVDNDGTPIYNRQGGKQGYSIVTSYNKCFFNCTKMADYASIPSGWKK